MSYTNYITNNNQTMAVHVVCASNPEAVYNEYHAEIKKRIMADGYAPVTSMDNLICMVILSFDCDDNYGEYDPSTGCGGYGNEFTLEECFRYVEESGGWREFDYEC